MISGILNIYKEKGFTSHDVVAKLRGILRQKKIGHTGTLDPQAEGVLPVCLGAGTKLCDMLTDTGKTYEAVLLLGCTTDTQDTTGTVQKTSPVTVTEEEALEAVSYFVGEYDQIPPMYSALKVQGKKLYELARAGVEVERQPRRVSIYRITVEEISLPRIRMAVTCSKGTYIRTLCHDIGEKLGCGGCMESLKRTKAAGFDIKDSLRLSQVEALVKEDALAPYVIPVDAMFPEAEQMRVLPEWEKLLKNGNPLRKAQLEQFCLQQTTAAQPGQLRTVPEGLEGSCIEKKEISGRIRVYDTTGRFCGLYGWEERRRLYVPEKMFLE